MLLFLIIIKKEECYHLSPSKVKQPDRPHKKQFQEQMETSFALHMMTGGNVSRPSPLYQKISARAGPVALQQKKKEREREKA